MRYSAIWPIYAADWDKMRITGNPAFSKSRSLALFDNDARYAIDHKARYQEIENINKVPWAMLAVIHRREGDGDFNTYLGNGQSLRRRTTEVPAGRGPFLGPDAFLRGALDACHVDGLDSVIDWRLEKQLFFLTSFNGWGYGAASPYTWGLTNIQRRGKYIRDHVYSSSAWDTQPGCAPLLWTIAQLDPSVTFTRETWPEDDRAEKIDHGEMMGTP